MVQYYHSLSVDATIMVSKNCPIIGKHIFITLYATIAAVWLAKNTLKFSFKVLMISKTARWIYFLLSKFGKKDKMQLLAKLKKSVHKVQSHLTILRKYFTVPFSKYKRLELKLRVFLAGHSVAMVTYFVTKMIPTFTGDWTCFGYHDCSINWVVIMNHENPCLGKCLILFWATLRVHITRCHGEFTVHYTYGNSPSIALQKTVCLFTIFSHGNDHLEFHKIEYNCTEQILKYIFFSIPV